MEESRREHSLIIVDDEPLARQAVSRMLRENFPAFPISGEADSGPTGLALFREKKPSIVLMDIRIPGFDGLETSRIILRECPGTQIIVLSAYDDFRFVQEALHEGVIGYLLKPVRESSLGELLEKAVSRINSLESRERDKQDILKFRSLAVREQVASFIYGNKGGIPAGEFAELSRPPLRKGYFLIFRLERDARLGSEEIRSINSSLDRLKGCYPGDWMGTYLPVFIRVDGESDTDLWRSEAEFLSREIIHLIRNSTGGRVSVGIGPVRGDPGRFSDSFRLAFDMLQDRDASGSFPASPVLNDSYPVEKESVFLQACRASNGTAAMKAAENLVDDLIRPEASLMDARFAVTEFLIVFRREWETISGKVQRRAMANLLREALLCNEHDVLREWFLLVVRDLIRNLIDTGSSGSGGEELIMRKVKHSIDLNNLREVSLESTSAAVGITPSYLSRLFKAKTGENFHDYVLNRRLNAAAGLLRETSLSAGEIARHVGYGDVAYFSRIFRKRFGSSPRDYRRNR